MKKRDFTLTPFSCYGVVILIGLLVLLYLFRVVISFTAMVYHQKFSAIASQRQIATLTESRHRSALTLIKNAINYDKNNSEYLYALGNYLNDYYGQSQLPEAQTKREAGFKEAEIWLKEAAMLDPGSPWYYYELGRLEQRRGSCPKSQELKEFDQCPVAKYFWLALQQAPSNKFLRKVIIKWYYQRNEKTALQLIRNILAKARRHAQITTLEISKFLYDLGMDYESDLNYVVSYQGKDKIRLMEVCDDTIFIQSQTSESVSDNKYIELGNDDGSAEWRTFLSSKTARVKKVICLPENLAEYNEAALKIFMRGGGGKNLMTHISIDEHLIKRYNRNTPDTQAWHEIRFDKKILQGKSYIHVYIRVFGARGPGDFLMVWGDQDTPTTHSVFNLDTTENLSSDQGIQTGEYMIRLILRKL